MRGLYLLVPILIACAYTGQAQSSLIFTIKQPQPLAAYAGNDTVVTKGSQVKLGNTVSAAGGTGAYTYAWTPATGLSNPNIANPVATIDTSITYTLTVSDNSCIAKSSIILKVDAVTAISDVDNPMGLQIFPNPNPGRFRIESDIGLNERFIVIEIFDTVGRLVYKKTVNGLMPLNETIQLSNTKGMLFIRISGKSAKGIWKMLIQ